MLDFLFTYYSHRPAQLEQWHPGPGVAAARRGGVPRASRATSAGRAGTVALDPAALPDRHRSTAAFVRALLAATASRAATAGLLRAARVGDGLPHRRTRGTPRVPLRLGAAGTDAVVESLPVHCTHHDAFRFFTAAARPRNAVPPTRADQVALGAAGLPARDHGPLQVGLQALPGHPGRAAGRLLRARRGRPRARHARQPLRPRRPRLPARPDRDPGRPRRVRPRPGRRSPGAPRRCATG